MPVTLRSMNIITKVIDDLDREGSKRIMHAAGHMRKAIVASAKASYPKRSGDLFKGVAAEKRGGGGSIKHYGVKIGGGGKRHRTRVDPYAVVGMSSPAYHAHLLEFGTKERTVKNYRGKSGRAVKVGKVTAKPFFAPTFEREAGAVEQILSGTWVQ